MELQIMFQENEDDIALSENLEVTQLGNNLFRLEHSPAFSEGIYFGDVVELAYQEDDSWQFIRLVEASGWHHFNYLLSKVVIESELFGLWLESITERGGFWEVAYRGVVFIHYPPDVYLDVEAEVQEVLARANS